jgi:hypothetical protein
MTPDHPVPEGLREHGDEHFDLLNFRHLRSMANRNHRMTRVEPKRLASPSHPSFFLDCRRVVGTRMGIRLHLTTRLCAPHGGQFTPSMTMLYKSQR